MKAAAEHLCMQSPQDGFLMNLEPTMVGMRILRFQGINFHVPKHRNTDSGKVLEP